MVPFVLVGYHIGHMDSEAASTSQEDHDVPSEPITSTAAYKSMREQLKDKHEIELGKELGSGSFSIVALGFSKRMKKNVAVKVIDRRKPCEYVKRFLPREEQLVQAVDHPSIVRVYQTMQLGPFTLFITEFCEGSDLLQKIQRLTKVPEADAKIHFRQLIQGLTYLDERSIVHRDIKCENIFLDKFENVKLGDFGFARYLAKNEYSRTFCGSRAYVAPEMLNAQNYTGNTSDIWSAGVVLYVTVTGLMPFNDSNLPKMIERQLKHHIRFPKAQPSLAVRTLIYQILHPFPPSRPTLKDMCTCEWLRDTTYFVRETPNAVRNVLDEVINRPQSLFFSRKEKRQLLPPTDQAVIMLENNSCAFRSRPFACASSSSVSIEKYTKQCN